MISKIMSLALLISTLILAKFANSHEMQHGFILSEDDKFASHLVASGHHSRQTELIGFLEIQNESECERYLSRKSESKQNNTYFVFQAQNLSLPELRDNIYIEGHIIESKRGEYSPKNIVVSSARFYVQKILLNIENPFFLSGSP